ncbi:MAG: adenine phosphoribosyltransferase [Sphingomonadales bacterium CG12_big_fil_rev_8_21_14_0_65_65_10]|nr:MAG: adenine phosphoribosyltransferase [Sphingomonadales bacterium CG12_big_fil_rev_8_21_14_0_65_65_10]
MTSPALNPDQLKALVRTVPDWPARGVQFRDITTLIADGDGLAATIAHLADRVDAANAQMVAGMEARGFIFGAAVAARLGLGFLPIRKPGKLPIETLGIDYALEYGADRLEIDPGAVTNGMRIALVDDLIATGGTACASAALLRKAGAMVETAHFVIDLPDLGGADRLRRDDIAVDALMAFDGE